MIGHFLIPTRVEDMKIAHDRAWNGTCSERPENSIFELGPGEGIFLTSRGVGRPFFA